MGQGEEKVGENNSAPRVMVIGKQSVKRENNYFDFVPVKSSRSWLVVLDAMVRIYIYIYSHFGYKGAKEKQIKHSAFLDNTFWDLKFALQRGWGA